jgi:rhodanese-related sulfurtransferase
MVRNPDFLAQVKEAIPDLSTTVIVLCRSGVRSIPAAKLLAQEGYSRAYNLAGGFEGDKNGNGHRANVNGWKVAGLPWQQK